MGRLGIIMKVAESEQRVGQLTGTSLLRGKEHRWKFMAVGSSVSLAVNLLC